MTALIALGGLTGLALLTVVSSLWTGYVLTVLWLWFIAPTFGLPVLGLAQAIGLSLVVRFLTSQMSSKPEEGHMVRAIVHLVLFPSLCLGIGYVVKGFL